MTFPLGEDVPWGLHHNSFLSLHSRFTSFDFVDASDVILGSHIQLIRNTNARTLEEDIDKCEKKVSRKLFSDELLQIILNKLIFLGIDLNKVSLNKVKTPVEFSNFLAEINKYHRGL